MKENVFQQKLLEKPYFIIKLTGQAKVQHPQSSQVKGQKINETNKLILYANVWETVWRRAERVKQLINNLDKGKYNLAMGYHLKFLLKAEK